MNENSNNNDNVICGSDAGPCAVIHHHCYQMVDLLTQCCRRSMCGLNPHALPHVPQHQAEVNEIEDLTKIRKKKPFDQGWKKQRNKKRTNNNKNDNHAAKDKKIDVNQFQRLQKMVGDMTEVTALLTEVAKDDACTVKNRKKTIEKKINPCHVDYVQMDELNDLIDNQCEKKENGLNKTLEKKDVKSIAKHECESDNKQSSNSEGESHFYPEESDFYETSSSEEGSVPSNFEDWHNNKRTRHEVKCKSYSD